MFSGSMVALITPFKNGKVDKDKIKWLVDWHIDSGTMAIVPCGTTGESATLSHEEHDEVIKLVVEYSKGRIPVIAGAGSNNTFEAIRLAKSAENSGADAVLMITPYYNKPSEDGIYEHFKLISENINIPIVLYNIASRTGVNMSSDLVFRLSKIKNIVAIKEASGNLNQMSDIINKCNKDFALISGDDLLTLPILSIGGKGVISVTANIVPRDVSDMVQYFNNGNISKALEYHYKLLNLTKSMFLETNPVPIKTALGLVGICESDVRLPLFRMQNKNFEILKKEIINYGLKLA